MPWGRRLLKHCRSATRVQKSDPLVCVHGSGRYLHISERLEMVISSTLISARTAVYGSMMGIWLSPMLMSIGYIIGPVVIGVWFLGALIGDLGILMGGVELGLWDSAAAADIKSSLGIGLMVGTGIGILVKGIIPKARDIFGSMFEKTGWEIIS